MRRAVLTGLAATLVLSACGGSRLNPFNWFRRSERTATVAPAPDAPADPRALVDQVTDLVVEPLTGGVVVRATGLPPTQGFWDAELVARPVEDGVLVYDFRVSPPAPGAAVSTVQSREITVGAYLSDIKLAGITQITVQGARSARTTRR